MGVSLVLIVLVAAVKEPEEVLRAYDDSVNALSVSKFEFVEWMYDRTNSDIGEQLAGRHEFTTYRDGPRWRVKQKRVAFRELKGVMTALDSVVECTVDLEAMRVLRLGAEGDESLTPKFRVTASEDTAVRGKQISAFYGCASILFGVVHSHDLRLSEILRGSETLELLPGSELIGGGATRVMRATGPLGTRTVWFDPASGFLPRRIEITAPGQTPLADTREGTRGMTKLIQSGGRPRMRVPRENRERFDNIVIENRDGKYVICALDYSATHVYDDGEQVPAR